MAATMKILLGILSLTTVVMSDSNVQQILKAGNDQFTSKMLQEVVQTELGKSCVLSAFSVLSPLAQLALASVGPSHDEILRVIGMPNDNVTKEAFIDVNTRLRSVKGVELKQANKLYIRSGFTLNDEFAVISKNVFESEVQNINFINRQGAADEINEWVEDHTNNRIKNLVDPATIDEYTAAVLVNAIYFKGNWKNPFDKYRTWDRPFSVSRFNKITVPMMQQSGSFKHAMSRELDAQFLEMPYEGDETSFVAVLPNDYDGIDALIEKFKDPTAFIKGLESMSERLVQVGLPKFKIETKTDLKKLLIKLNITQLFSPTLARLNNLIKDEKDLYVTDAIQKVFIEVNEEGAEAAVANKFGIGIGTSVGSNPYQYFNADHPFLFFLMEKSNILFCGVFRPEYVEPEEFRAEGTYGVNVERYF